MRTGAGAIALVALAIAAVPGPLRAMPGPRPMKASGSIGPLASAIRDVAPQSAYVYPTFTARGIDPRHLLVYGGIAPPLTEVTVDGRRARILPTRTGQRWEIVVPRRGSLRVVYWIGHIPVLRLPLQSPPPTLSLPAGQVSLGIDALSAANLLADEARAKSATTKPYRGSELVSYETWQTTLAAARGLGLAIPAGWNGMCLVGLVSGEFPVGTPLKKFLFVVDAQARPFTIQDPGGGISTVPAISAARTMEPRGTRISVYDLAAPILFDPGPPRADGSVAEALQGYYQGLFAQDAALAQLFVTKELWRSLGPLRFTGLSNPHFGGYQVAAIAYPAPDVALASVIVLQDYTGFGPGLGIVGRGTDQLVLVRRSGGWRVALIL